MTQWSRWVGVFALVGLASGCGRSHEAAIPCTTSAECPSGSRCVADVCEADRPDAATFFVDTGNDGAPIVEHVDAGSPHTPACPSGRACEAVRTFAVDQIDLLLVIDNSGSMTDEQISLVTEIPRMLSVLSSGDRNADGAQDFQPARSIHVGAVSSDMGTGAVSGVDSCTNGFGDDGIMVSTSPSTSGGCMASYPSSIFEFRVGDDVTAFAQSVSCVAALGTDGCGFEQQLDAALKAVSLAPGGDGRSPVDFTRPGYTPPLFREGTFGHGGPGGANDGFLRPDSVLAVLLVSDEEDCSTPNTEIFSGTNPAFSSVDLNLRCHTFPGEQYPVERYVGGLVGLRYYPDMLVFGAIVGVPPGAVAEGLSYDAMLALPEMEERIDPVLRNRLMPSCTSPMGRGVAYPPRRIVGVARGLQALGAGTTVHSICDTSYLGAIDAVIDQLGATLEASCLPRPLAHDAAGLVGCDLYTILPAIGGTSELQHCSDLGSARISLADVLVESPGGVETRREVCMLPQLQSEEVGETPGWYYDDGTRPGSDLPMACSQRIALSEVTQTAGIDVVLDCLP